MMEQHDKWGGHERFQELCALASSDTLTPDEWAELEAHLGTCASCGTLYHQYRVLAVGAIPGLAATCGYSSEQGSWDDDAVRTKLFERIQAEKQVSFKHLVPMPSGVSGWFAGHRRWAVAAACLVVMMVSGAYYLGRRGQSEARRQPAYDLDRPGLAEQKRSLEGLAASQAATIAQLQRESLLKQQELSNLHLQLRSLKDRSASLASEKQKSEEAWRTIARERDTLNAQWLEAGRQYQTLQTELASLRAERERAVLKASSLEAKMEELGTLNQDQERRLKETERYLEANRDIRELMGARKLYIADVFDVDSRSRQRSPFGRVFYTQNKSLVFYAFDLDRQAGVKNASAFQVWGQRESAQGDRPRPASLGILYMDSESNRRWVLRSDDAKQLAEIDAVFVTVEPDGGSKKPTTKPFLYALLRKEANHP